MSAHVVPKAQAFASDEDEKTTIESGWEDEASTTIEQGELADRLRTPFIGVRNNGTHITSTNGGALDEPTVDDRRANISVVTPTTAAARLVITQGNDTGQALDVQPGKTFTIGRAIDNDLVLTDIAVSRKHFDLRHDDGGWVIVDRGSGNGTVINGNVEDQPFLLAHGDLIEIGNTTFRFDHPGGAARVSAFTMDLDEEASTVAGKPLREEPAPLAPPVQVAPPMLQRERPRTVPPPAPLPRPRPPSVGPPPAYGVGASLPSAATTLPMPQQGLPPRPMPALGAHAPTMLGGDAMVRPQVLANAHPGLPVPGMLPSTLPGQGPPVAPPPSRQLPYAYPNLADLPPQHAQLRAGGTAPRDATSTALVQPAPYGQLPPQYQTTLSTPQLSRRTKLWIGLAGLTVVATIATVAIIKGTANDREPVPAAAAPAVTPAKPVKPTVEAIDDTPTKANGAPPSTDGPTSDATKAEAQKREAELAAKREAAVKAEADKRDAAAKREAELAAKREAAVKAEADKRDAAAKREAELAARREAAARTETAKREAAAKRDQERREAAARREAELAAKRERERAQRTTTTKRVATADAGAAKSAAEQLYRNKKFNDAAATLRKAAAATSGSEASALKSVAAVYEQVGRNYNVGMGPATKPTDAFAALTRAQNLDRGAGGVFGDEIRSKLAQVAPRAAISYMAAKQLESAARAVRTAETLGAGNSSTKTVRDALESQAGQLYAQAIKELDDDPAAAKAKLRQIKAIVDAKSPWAAKAQKALNGGG